MIIITMTITRTITTTLKEGGVLQENSCLLRHPLSTSSRHQITTSSMGTTCRKAQVWIIFSRNHHENLTNIEARN
jgi:hypothetical protein